MLSSRCRALPSVMATRWKHLYRAALREPNPAMVPQLCDIARHAIHDRMIELASLSQPAIPEREVLHESLQQLFLRELTSPMNTDQ